MKMTSTFLRLRGIWNIAWNRSVQPRDEVLMVPYKCCCFSARSVQGRIECGVIIGHGGGGGGVPSSMNFSFRPEGYSNKPNA